MELFTERGYGVVAVHPDTAGLAELETIKNVVTLEGDVSTEKTNVEAVRCTPATRQCATPRQNTAAGRSTPPSADPGPRRGAAMPFPGDLFNFIG
ncbi:hypothetical protein [Frankia sp. Cppng1_Ct_nod]|uniref:hypothetical protein n=1 Tax=Frankia sp. Cppng1_Ct_nod TaxID=2897162 RepID=UPI001F5E481E|nr:hypothetical protein [Frankia sp. Cppng1_Ct_nod]